MTDLLFYADLLPTQAGQIDVVELCGGMGGVLKLSITRGLTTGEKFDLRTNWDLVKAEHHAEFWLYMRKNKPRAVVMAPPCTAFNALQRLFKHLHPNFFRLAMKIGLRLANLSAAVALFQLKTHHDFMRESFYKQDVVIEMLEVHFETARD